MLRSRRHGSRRGLTPGLNSLYVDIGAEPNLKIYIHITLLFPACLAARECRLECNFFGRGDNMEKSGLDVDRCALRLDVRFGSRARSC